jgi:hypothetical protein
MVYRDTPAEACVEALLAARDAYLDATNVVQAPPVDDRPVQATKHECPVCMDTFYEELRVPRLLVSCGHTACEGCLDGMLERVPVANGSKMIDCPMCKTSCRVQRSLANSLPKVFALFD